MHKKYSFIFLVGFFCMHGAHAADASYLSEQINTMETKITALLNDIDSLPKKSRGRVDTLLGNLFDKLCTVHDRVKDNKEKFQASGRNIFFPRMKEFILLHETSPLGIQEFLKEWCRISKDFESIAGVHFGSSFPRTVAQYKFEAGLWLNVYKKNDSRTLSLGIAGFRNNMKLLLDACAWQCAFLIVLKELFYAENYDFASAWMEARDALGVAYPVLEDGRVVDSKLDSVGDGGSSVGASGEALESVYDDGELHSGIGPKRPDDSCGVDKFDEDQGGDDYGGVEETKSDDYLGH